MRSTSLTLFINLILIKYLTCTNAQEQLIETGGRSGLTLWNAAKDGNITLVQSELAKGVDPDWQHQEHGNGAIHQATFANQTAILRLLLSKGANPNLRDRYGSTPLHLAARTGDQDELINILADNGANVDMIDGPDGNGNTPLISAAQNGNLDTVKLLINKKADIDIRRVIGFTALIMAVARNEPDIALFLLQSGANPLIKDIYGKTAADHAREHGLHQLANSMENSQAVCPSGCGHGICTGFNVCKCSNGYTGSNCDTRLVLTAGTGPSGLTLWNAADDGNITIVRAELDKGTDPDWQNEGNYGSGQGALHRATIANQTTIVSVLLAAGANPDLRDNFGHTAISVAASLGQREEVIGILADAGAKIDSQDNVGATPLMRATISGHLDTVKFLINKNAHINYKKWDGWTPLKFSVVYNKPDIAVLLLQRGANPLVQDNDGMTAADHARKKGLHQLARIIEGFSM